MWSDFIISGQDVGTGNYESAQIQKDTEEKLEALKKSVSLNEDTVSLKICMIVASLWFDRR